MGKCDCYEFVKYLIVISEENMTVGVAFHLPSLVKRIVKYGGNAFNLGSRPKNQTWVEVLCSPTAL